MQFAWDTVDNVRPLISNFYLFRFCLNLVGPVRAATGLASQREASHLEIRTLLNP